MMLFLPVISYPFSTQKPEEVKIGLLIPDKNALAAKNGAELAIRVINKTSSNVKFSLVVHTMEGAWGAGADEAVKLIFDDKVAAIVGSHDGRNAHLVEQACTKSGVVFLSAWTGDPTLSQAFVPWFFNVAPGNTIQAEVLTGLVFKNSKTVKTALITDQEYDSKSVSKSFLHCIKQQRITDPVKFEITSSNNNLPSIIDDIKKQNITKIVFFANTANTEQLVSLMQKNSMKVEVFAPLIILNENQVPVKELKVFEGIQAISSKHWVGAEAEKFRIDYKTLSGTQPGCVAAYAYDAVKILAEVIISAGTERESIQKALLSTPFKGVTGEFRFDKMGNRIGNITVIKIENGLPVEVSY